MLDEPTNGLDPAGIADLRRLVRDHARSGGSVLLSSHLLGELEQVCDRIGVVRSGHLIAEDRPAALGPGGPVVVVLRCDRPSAAVRLVQEDPAVGSVAVDGSVVRIGLRSGTAADAAAADSLAAGLNGTLVAAGVAVYELATEQHGLEAAFLALTGQVPA